MLPSPGKNYGLADSADRGKVMIAVIELIAEVKPRGFVLENVANLARQHRSVLKEILSLIKAAGYKVYFRILDTKHFGLPQSRPRLYIVGQRVDAVKSRFTWPPLQAEATNIDDFLLPDDLVSPGIRTKGLSSLGQWHLEKAGDEMEKKKHISTFTKTCCIDVSAGKSRHHVTVGYSPCITKSRGATGGYYLTTKLRMMDLKEICALQGFPTHAWDIEEHILRKPTYK